MDAFLMNKYVLAERVLHTIPIVFVIFLGTYLFPVFVWGSMDIDSWAKLLLSCAFFGIVIVDMHPILFQKESGNVKNNRSVIRVGVHHYDLRQEPVHVYSSQVIVLRWVFIAIFGPTAIFCYMASAHGGFHVHFLAAGLLSNALYLISLFYFFLTPKEVKISGSTITR